MSIYMDYNASTPIDRRVLELMADVYSRFYGNPDSRTHDFGLRAKNVVEVARGQVAALLDVDKSEIVFTSGATESDNLAVLGLEEYGIATGRKHIISTAIEHKAVLEPIRVLARRGFEVEFVAPDAGGRVSSEALLARVRPDTLLVSVMHANNETGIIQPVEEIGQALLDTETYFHVDAAQTCGKLVEELRGINYDLLSITAHKMYGPQGIGALVLKKKNYKRPPIKPLFYGGEQENGLRPGTLPVALIAGLGKACEINRQEYRQNLDAYRRICSGLLKELEASGINYVVNGDPLYCIPNTLNVSFLGSDSEAVMVGTKAYCGVSNGSACTSHDYAPSHVLTAMGLPEAQVESAIRISWGKEPFDIRPFRELIDFVKRLT